MVNKETHTGRIGILGGMGPMATAYLYEQIIKNTPASTDQQHLEVIIASLPKTPDRTKALLENGISPVPSLLYGVNLLLDAGVDFIVIPCNTAHKFLPQLLQEINFNVMDMIACVREEIKKLGITNVGLLATSGTIQTGLYEEYLLDTATIHYPDKSFQTAVMDIIYGKQGIKAGFITHQNKIKLLECIEDLKNNGAECVILGCTELPLLVSQEDTDVILLEPMEILAKGIVARTKIKESL